MNNIGYKTAWFVLLIVVVATVAMVFTPVWLIQPFAAQTGMAVEISFLLKSWSPLLTILATIVSLGLAFYIWTNAKRWFSKAFLLFPLFVVLIFTWFARQNHFEWMFNPLANPAYAKVSETDFVADDDVVMAVKINSEAVAYPVRQLAYHHLVHDVVGGTPITATY